MSIKFKLILLLLLVCLALGSIAGHLLSGAWRVNHQVGLFVPATEYLLSIAEAQTAITAQIKAALDYFIVADPQGLETFHNHGNTARGAFRNWQAVIRRQQALGVVGEADDLNQVIDMESRYRRWEQEITRQLRQLTDDPDQRNQPPKLSGPSAGRSFRSPERIMALEDELLPRFNDALADGFMEVEDAYHGLLMAFGRIALPFSGGDIARLEEAHAVIDVVISGHRLNSITNLQLAALIRYLLNGSADDLLNYHNRSYLAWHNFRGWQEALAQRARLGSEDEAVPRGVDFQRMQSLMEQIVTLKQSGDDSTALELAGSKLRIDLVADGDENLYHLLQQAGRDLAGLAKATSRAGAMALMTLLLLILILFVVELRRQIQRGGRLRDGMLRVAAGDLESRIGLLPTDELGQLAGVFDQMVGELRKSSHELEALNRELEQRVNRRTLELTHKNHELEAFNSMVSHDLRSQLTIVSGLTQLLQSAQADGLVLETELLLQRILQAGERMNQIVESLHSLAKMGAGNIDPQPVDLSEMCSQLARELEDQHPAQEVRFAIQPGIVVMGDRALLQIMLGNLLGNAWKYSSGREQGRIDFGCEKQNGEPVIFLRDNGIGFNQTEEAKLFVPFQRLKSAAEFSGRGIGLSIVQRIVECHGGQIWAHGVPGEGAVFYLRLPGLKVYSETAEHQVANE